MGCYGLKGAYQHPDVRIGWYPFVAIHPTAIMTNPGWGRTLKILGKGQTVGLQSVRNPKGLLDPAPRLPRTIDGVQYSWVYSRQGTITGWVKTLDIVPDWMSDIRPPLCGPGGLDFEVGRTLPLEKKPSSCGRLSVTRPKKIVSARETYLRYSERGTAFHHLHRGDVVRLLLVNAAHGFAFCEVLEPRAGSAAMKGSRGFVMHSSLTKP